MASWIASVPASATISVERLKIKSFIADVDFGTFTFFAVSLRAPLKTFSEPGTILKIIPSGMKSTPVPIEPDIAAPTFTAIGSGGFPFLSLNLLNSPKAIAV